MLPNQIRVLWVAQAVPEVLDGVDGGFQVIPWGVQSETDWSPPPAHHRDQILQVANVRDGGDGDGGVAVYLAMVSWHKVLYDPELSLLVQATR